MQNKMTWKKSGTWAVITGGLAVMGYWLVAWLFAASRAREGGVDLDEVAASTTLSLKGIVAGLLITAIGVIARLIFRSRKLTAQ